MSDDKEYLPFLLYDAMLEAMGVFIHGGTAIARGMIAPLGRPASVPPAGSVPVQTTQMAASAPALATAIDDQARAALADRETGGQRRTATKKGAANLDALKVDAPNDDPPKPERVAGPKPFKPQVGP